MNNNMDTNCLYQMNCTAEQIIFRNESNGYTVLSVLAGGEKVTAVGNMPWVNVGESLSLIGRWKPHHNFGMQFFVESYERFMPSTSECMVKYLSSGIIKGIGLGIAGKIVEKYAEKTLEVLCSSPEKLCEIKGITKEKAERISRDLNEIININKISENLNGYGILPDETIKIYKILGSEAMTYIEKNPYVLCKDGINIDFEKVEIIAEKIGIGKDNKDRISQGIIYILKHNEKNGHTCLPENKVAEVASDFLGIEKELIVKITEEMVENKKLVREIIKNTNFLFTPEIYDSESYCALRIKMMIELKSDNILKTEEKIKIIENSHKIKYSNEQKKAINTACSTGVMLLTGGPGTGKTTTLRAIIEIFKKDGKKVLVSAPTGRAAQRISELSGYEAQTIHRMLEARKDSVDSSLFNKNENNPLDCDVLVIDEVSMVDLNLFESVLRALPMGVVLILVGDIHQLPSVGAGNILWDLVSCGVVPVVELQEIFRQSETSMIVINAHKIVKGEMPDLRRRDNDFFFLEDHSLKSIQDTVLDLYSRRLPKSYGYNNINDIQILTPGRKGMIGSCDLNLRIRDIVNPKTDQKKEININGTILREQDKVMQTKNNYCIYWEKADGTHGEGVYNGDMGIILEIDMGSSYVAIKYDDKIAVYDMDMISDLEHAYAVTVHKSQGSEFEAVIMPLYGKNSKLHYRNLLYTGVTRAKSKLIIVGEKITIENMVQNDKKARRYSGLSEFLSKK